MMRLAFLFLWLTRPSDGRARAHLARMHPLAVSFVLLLVLVFLWLKFPDASPADSSTATTKLAIARSRSCAWPAALADILLE